MSKTKALFCANCGDIRGLPPTTAPLPYSQCCCGRVRGRWVDPQRGTALFNETLDPIPAFELETLGRLAEQRYQAQRVLGVTDEEELDEFCGPDWAEQWKALFLRLHQPLQSDCEAKPMNAWLLGIHNALLVGAFDRGPGFEFGRQPSDAEYAAWETAEGYLFKQVGSLIARTRPGYSSDTKMVDFLHFAAGTWARPEVLEAV